MAVSDLTDGQLVAQKFPQVREAATMEYGLAWAFQIWGHLPKQGQITQSTRGRLRQLIP